MAYTTINKSSEYFNIVTYSGNGSTQSITGVGFQPDWVWIKTRNTAGQHEVFDAVRGATKYIVTNASDPENTVATSLTSFDSDGFSLSSQAAVNNGSNTFVSWNWLGGGTGVSNTDGNITSTVSANTTSGFSIVTYTGNSSSSATVGHGLGVAPAMILNKCRTGANAAQGFFIYHKGLSANNSMLFNTNAQAGTGSYSSGILSTSPTTDTFGFTAGSGGVINVNESSSTYVSYCFAEKKGFSKFGSYTGNGNADGTFIYTGFKPAYVLTKRIDGSENWVIQDNKQSPFNPTYDFLLADSDGVPTAGGTRIDLLSNGFKVRTTSVYSNASGGTYIYMAFAENPLVGTNGVPATAR
jgi:hypothetical protein